MTTYTGTAGNDVWTNIHAGDLVDGVAGDDTVSVDMSSETRNIVYNAVTAATATGMIPVANTRVRNVEHIAELKTGSGADSLTISLAQGAFTWYAGTGSDKLTLDYSADTAGFSVYASSGGYYFSATASQIYDVENLVITGGSGDDSFSDMHNKVVIDGGAGSDSLVLDLSGIAGNYDLNAVTAATATGVVLSDGTAIKNVEHITDLTTGAGDDTFRTAIAQGAFTWHAGTGHDHLVFDGTADTGAFSAFLTGGSYYVGATGSTVEAAILSVAVSGGHGDDNLSGTDGNDTLKGSSGNDTLDGLKGVDTIDGGAGTDQVAIHKALHGVDVVYDATAAASATGFTMVDGATYKNVEQLSLLETDSGNDTLILTYTQGTFTWQAGDGNDRLVADYSAATSDFSAYTSGDSYYIGATGSSAYNIESISLTGGAGNDDLSGTANNDTLKGGSGDDVLNGLEGVSTIDGGTGTDTVSLDLSDATAAILYNAIAAAGSTGLTLADGSTVRLVEKLSELDTGSGDDQLTVTMTQGSFTWQAGAGNDRLTAIYTADTAGFSAYVSGDSYYLGATGSSAYNVESVNITGGSGNDDISGTAANDTLAGGDGDDRLDGLAGVSILDGGSGDDTVSLDLSTTILGIAYNAVTAGTAAGITLTDGSRVKNAEHIGTLSTGSGNDGLTVALAQSTFTWNANGGTDRLTADYSADTGGFSAYVSGNSYYLSATGSSAYDVELVNITGGSGDDDISGTAGNDTLQGNGGNDSLDGAGGSDTASYANATGAVTVSLALQGVGQNTANGGLDHLLNFENLLGSAFADTLTCDSGANIITGGLGADTMAGNGGNDTYYVDNAGDLVNETAGQGSDLVYASVTYNATGQDIENITLTGLTSISATGNALNNTIVGNANNNNLNGGAGADSLAGGTGNDTYIVDNTGDETLEKAGAGTDIVFSSITWTLAANIENLVLSTGRHINGTGNALNNSLTGNAGNNILDGGAGSDHMTGGAGNDIYVVDSYGDVVTENPDSGYDAVWSSVSHNLAANVEELFLIGSAAINGTGNDLDNLIAGNGATNRLDGGIGHDTLSGGGGDDIYTVDDVGDVILEGTGGGDDIVFVTTLYDYVLPAEVENMILTGATPAIGFGNDLANQLTGNANGNYLGGLGGTDILRGNDGDDRLVGGAATDKLYGGNGADQFLFSAPGAANGVDRIEDFVSGTDFLAFTGSDYGFASGTHLTSAQFFNGTTAVGSGPQFFYNTTTHTLCYDSDGAGGAALVGLAIFDNFAALAASDFVFL
ncbi:MAG: hypothetical protein JF615_06590, partial [Asticcacaulis sp.]|nr:hypothetical protein [Asticcacaulis sp.]